MSKSPHKRFLDRMVREFALRNAAGQAAQKADKDKPLEAEDVIRAAKRLPTAHFDDIPQEVLKQFETVGPKCWCVIMDNILHHSHLVERLERIGECVARAGQADTTALDEMILKREARRKARSKEVTPEPVKPPPRRSEKPKPQGPIFALKLDPQLAAKNRRDAGGSDHNTGSAGALKQQDTGPTQLQQFQSASQSLGSASMSHANIPETSKPEKSRARLPTDESPR